MLTPKRRARTVPAAACMVPAPAPRDETSGDRTWCEPTLHCREPGHGLGVERVDLGVQLGDLEARLDVGRIFHVAANSIAGRLPVLGDEHEARKEDALQRRGHGQE